MLSVRIPIVRLSWRWHMRVDREHQGSSMTYNNDLMSPMLTLLASQGFRGTRSSAHQYASNGVKKLLALAVASQTWYVDHHNFDIDVPIINDIVAGQQHPLGKR